MYMGEVRPLVKRPKTKGPSHKRCFNALFGEVGDHLI
jgi:hypothetical protein